ncbi:MAG: sugar phosphate isomerase/epimerase [Caldilineaceae bacterium]|nr:sugar phosphate isomerase/epimerase [Caldilineaceae bacterium]
MSHQFSICSYSFRRSFESGAMDYRGYVEFNQRHGFSQLDPWMKHVEPALEDRAWLADAKSMAEDAGLPYGCIAVDGGHMYEADAARQSECREMALRWLDVAASLGATQMRIDSGGPEALTDEIFEIIVEGYNELIPRAHAANVEILVENHWGPTKYAENTVRLLEEVEGLGLLFDTNNWADGTHERAWQLCAPYARLTHFKTFSFDSRGDDPSVDLQKACSILRETGYSGVWGIESTPEDGDEEGAAVKTMALLQRVLGA